MKNLLILLFLLPTLTQAQNPITNSEQQRFEAMVKRDTITLKKLLADDLVYIHSNAYLENKAQHLEAVGTGSIQYQSIERVSVQTRQYGKVAINNGVAHVKGVFKTTPFDVQFRYTAVYRKRKKIWQLCNWQSTRM
jgi:ketosteroid isomerase-like protein